MIHLIKLFKKLHPAERVMLLSDLIICTIRILKSKTLYGKKLVTCYSLYTGEAKIGQQEIAILKKAENISSNDIENLTT